MREKTFFMKNLPIKAKTYFILINDKRYGAIETTDVTAFLEEEYGDILHRISVDEENRKIYIHMSIIAMRIRTEKLVSQENATVNQEELNGSSKEATQIKLLNQLEIIETDYDGSELYLATVKNNTFNRSVLIQIGVPEDQLPPCEDSYEEIDIIDLAWQYANARYKHDRFVWIV